MSNYQFVINHQTPVIESAVVVKKPKHPGRVAAGKRLAQWNRENKGLAPAKTKKTTLKSMLDEIKKDTNNPVSILIAIDETIRILNDRGLEICLTLKKTS